MQEKYLSLLRSFLELEVGWDGYDAVPLQKPTFENMVNLIKALPTDVLEKWNMFPSDNGTVLMVLKKRLVATVNIGNSTVSYIAKTSSGELKRRGHETFNLTAVAALMIDFAENIPCCDF